MGFHRKAEPGAKVAMGSVTLSSYKSNLTINHGLGVKPTTVFIVSHESATEYVAGGLISDNINPTATWGTALPGNTTGYRKNDNIAVTDTSITVNIQTTLSYTTFYWIAVAE